jgi:hypothetical protein
MRDAHNERLPTKKELGSNANKLRQLANANKLRQQQQGDQHTEETLLKKQLKQKSSLVKNGNLKLNLF